MDMEHQSVLSEGRHRFTAAGSEEVEVIGGKTHLWHSKPGFSQTDDLLFVRVLIEPGEGHSFHYHPNKEEVIYFIADHKYVTLRHEGGEVLLDEPLKALEDEFGIEIPDEDAEKITTVQNAIDYANAHQKA